MSDEVNNMFNSEEDTTVKFEPLTAPENVANNSSLLMKKLADNAPLDGIDAVNKLQIIYSYLHMLWKQYPILLLVQIKL